MGHQGGKGIFRHPAIHIRRIGNGERHWSRKAVHTPNRQGWPTGAASVCSSFHPYLLDFFCPPLQPLPPAPPGKRESHRARGLPDYRMAGFPIKKMNHHIVIIEKDPVPLLQPFGVGAFQFFAAQGGIDGIGEPLDMPGGPAARDDEIIGKGTDPSDIEDPMTSSPFLSMAAAAARRAISTPLRCWSFLLTFFICSRLRDNY